MGKLLLYTLITAISLPVCAQRLYQAPLGDEKWRMTGTRLRCGLSLNVPNFGTAYFEQYAAKDPHFIMTKSQQLQHSARAVVTAKPPQWKPALRYKLLTKTTIKPGKYAIFLTRNSMLRVLYTLADGKKTQFSYRSDLGDKVLVELSPVHFQSQYDRYMQCVGRLLPFDFNMVRHQILYYGFDQTLLSDAVKRELDKVSLYVRVDRSVRRVKVAGFADNAGRLGYNNAVSQLRAEAVKNYLLRRGVPDSKLEITWYGQKRPAASNKTEQGRALNRRVVIDLYK